MNRFRTRTDPIDGPTYSPTIAWDSGLPNSAIRSKYIAPDPCLPRLRFVAAREKAVSERALVPEEKILDGALSSIPRLPLPALAPDFANRLEGRVPLRPRAIGAVRRHRASSRWDHDLDVRGADLTSRASSENQTVMSPRLLRPRSYTRQLVTRYFVLYLGFTLVDLRAAMGYLPDIRCIEKLSRCCCRSQEGFVHQSRAVGRAIELRKEYEIRMPTLLRSRKTTRWAALKREWFIGPAQV